MIIIAVVIAPFFGEAAWPTIQWGISSPDFITLWNEYTVFGLGFPPLMMFITGLPTVLAAYIVLFGDVLQTKALVEDGAAVNDKRYRVDDLSKPFVDNLNSPGEI